MMLDTHAPAAAMADPEPCGGGAFELPRHPQGQRNEAISGVTFGRSA
jgi:hypothetical protein